MSCNESYDHVHVLPEDDDNRRLAIGFFLGLPESVRRQFFVRPVAGGWTKVLDQFESVHVGQMNRSSKRFMILLIDFDDRGEERLARAKGAVPGHLADRVFVLGAKKEPRDLKAAGLGSYEEIGQALAGDCREDTTEAWEHPQLQHNAAELERLRRLVRPFLFQ